MATRRCKNGHLYDASIYGDNCPCCPSTGGETIVNGGNNNAEQHTIGLENINNGGGTIGGTANTVHLDPANLGGGHTVIKRTNMGENQTGGRKLVGLLVSYDTNPLGEVYRIYEGKNIIGRDATVDIPITTDSNISGTHVLILYREVEGIFWLVDQNSSNGTYLNNIFAGEKTKLNTGDVITIGNTRLIFWAIPKL